MAIIIVENYDDIGCDLSAGYTPTIVVPKRYLGQKQAFDKKNTFQVTKLLKTGEDAQAFFRWWRDDLNFGIEPFEMELPIMGILTKMWVILETDLSPIMAGGIEDSVTIPFTVTAVENMEQDTLSISGIVATGGSNSCVYDDPEIGCTIDTEFTVSTAGTSQGSIVYKWTARGAEIISGEGTSVVTIRTTGSSPSTSFGVTVDVSDDVVTLYANITGVHTREASELPTLFEATISVALSAPVFSVVEGGSMQYEEISPNLWRAFSKDPITRVNIGGTSTSDVDNNIISVIINDGSTLTSFYGLCSYTSLLESFEWIGVVNPLVTDASYMLSNNAELTSMVLPDMSNIDIGLFMLAFNPKVPTIPYFDSGSMTSINRMFKNNSAMTSVPDLDLSNVGIAEECFGHCTSLTYIRDLGTSGWLNMAYLFNGCTNLKCIEAIDAGSATYVVGMFNGCVSLEAPNLTEQDDIIHGGSYTNPNPCPNEGTAITYEMDTFITT